MNSVDSFLDISLFNKILILVEDRGKVPINELDTFGNRRQALGALGRLEGLNYIQRVKNTDADYFVLTEKGDSIISYMLENLPDASKQWDGLWRMILFDVPESKRTVRQMIRLKLMDLGARMLQSSVWITPYNTVIERFQMLISDHELSDSVHFFEAKHLGGDVINISVLWDLPHVEKAYQQLFISFKKQYPQLKKSKSASFTAKCMIVNLALHAKNDPRLPQQLMPKDWIGYEAESWYQKLRIYCN